MKKEKEEDGRNGSGRWGERDRREGKTQREEENRKERRSSWARGRKEGRRKGAGDGGKRGGTQSREEHEKVEKTERQIGGQRGKGPWGKKKRERDRKQTRPPNIKYLTGDDKSNGNYCGKNIIRNLIEVKQNLHNTAN